MIWEEWSGESEVGSVDWELWGVECGALSVDCGIVLGSALCNLWNTK